MLVLQDVTKTYRKQGETVTAVRGISGELSPGRLVVVHGPSGSGKSTLLLMLGGMLAPDSGRVLFEGRDLYALSAGQRNRHRQRQVGFVFQRFCLLPYLTAYDNIRLPLRLAGHRTDAARRRVTELADRLGLLTRLGRRPAELSVGEAQRVAVARALAASPGMLLADEPTGNLDEANSRIVAQCLAEEARAGKLVLMVTHNPALLDMGDRRILLSEGRLVRDQAGPAPAAPTGRHP